MNFLKEAKAKAEGMLKTATERSEAVLAGHSEEEYEEQCRGICPAEVFMFSGCMDEQTSADVSNVQSFGLPPGSGPGGAGGACTNALLARAYKSGSASWMTVLTDMCSFLEKKGYTQKPMLSTSRKTDLSSSFYIGQNTTGRKLAVLIGINYTTHEQGRLSGCVNDVVSMKEYICRTEGFTENSSTMKILVDAPHRDIGIPTIHPNKKNIMEAINWIVGEAREGDALFFHYSGHGGQQKDQSGDEADGLDETLIPEDYTSSGVITDDQLFELLVSRLPSSVRLVAVMDCCHSGTILDLPYTFVADKQNLAAASSGGFTIPNPDFVAIIKKLFKMGIEVIEKKYPGVRSFAGKFMAV